MVDAMNPLSISRRVLVVDDERLICMLVESILTDAGYEVTTANSIPEALASVEAGQIDLAILDLNLKGTKAYPVADRLTAAGIPFLFATGSGPDASEFGDQPRIAKPFNEAELLAAVAALME
jgi:CheY-like chemotaxis protein